MSDILEKSNLSTVTTKKVRRTLEKEIGLSLDHIKKDLNPFIESIFVKYQEMEEQKKTPVAKASKIKSEPIKVEKVSKASELEKPKKVTKRKKKDDKEVKVKKPIDWPVNKISSPLKEIIGTDLVKF